MTKRSRGESLAALAVALGEGMDATDIGSRIVVDDHGKRLA